MASAVLCEIDSVFPTTVASAVIAVRLILASSCVCWDAESLTLLVTVWKPESEKTMVYSPGGTFAKT